MRVRSSRKDSERLQRRRPGGPAGRRLVVAKGPWPLLPPPCRGCGHATRSRAGIYFAAFCFPSCDADLTQGCTCCQLCVLKQTGPWRVAVSPWSPQEQEFCSGIRAMCLRLALSPHYGMDTTPLCRVPHVSVFTQCSEGDSLLALGSLQKL